MNPNIRGVLFAAVSLLLLAAACGPAPTYQPPAQAPSDTPVSGIPVSAADIGYRAFFCERNVSYGVLSLPASVSFEKRGSSSVLFVPRKMMSPVEPCMLVRPEPCASQMSQRVRSASEV